MQSLKDVVRGFPQPAGGRPGDPGLFGPDSLAWRINRESVLLLGGGRALLLQVAHPMVAAGVADHSDFTANPYDRLWRTVDTALTVIFGDAEQAATAVERVTQIHRHVNGARRGRSYSALDPDLLLWVHATLVDSSIAAYDAFVRPLPFAVRERYYLEMRRMGAAVGIPEELHPSSYAAFREYMDDTIAGLEINDECRGVARQVLSPPMPAPLLPAGLLGGLGSIGLLPPRVRSELRLRWNRGTEVAFHAMAASLRATVPLVPSGIRFWPHARDALHRVGPNRASVG
ncbi:MAG: oxygenase MpaB family protein [Actinomycetota bacterium]